MRILFNIKHQTGDTTYIMAPVDLPTLIIHQHNAMAQTSNGRTFSWISWIPTSRVRTSRHCVDKKWVSECSGVWGCRCRAVIACYERWLNICKHTYINTECIHALVPKSFILSKASSRRLPFSTPDVTNGIGISLLNVCMYVCMYVYMHVLHTVAHGKHGSKVESEREYGPLDQPGHLEGMTCTSLPSTARTALIKAWFKGSRTLCHLCRIIALFSDSTLIMGAFINLCDVW